MDKTINRNYAEDAKCSPGENDCYDLNTFINLEEEDLLLGFFFMGIPKEKKESNRTRIGLDEVSTWVR